MTFFEHIIRHDRPVDEILLAEYTFLDRRLAEHYGCVEQLLRAEKRPAETARPGWARVSGLPSRGGVFGLGAILTSTSAPLRTSPVKRGDWILRRVLGTPVPPPPPDAGSIPADAEHQGGRSVRELLPM